VFCSIGTGEGKAVRGWNRLKNKVFLIK
jgi:hypothetical protein